MLISYSTSSIIIDISKYNNSYLLMRLAPALIEIKTGDQISQACTFKVRIYSFSINVTQMSYNSK